MSFADDVERTERERDAALRAALWGSEAGNMTAPDGRPLARSTDPRVSGIAPDGRVAPTPEEAAAADRRAWAEMVAAAARWSP